MKIKTTLILWIILLAEVDLYSQFSPYKIKSDIPAKSEIPSDVLFEILSLTPKTDSAGNRYFVFYDSYINYFDTPQEEYYLGLAMYFKERGKEIEKEKDQKINALLEDHFDEKISPEDVASYEQRRNAISETYKKDIDFFQKKAVEYWFHYRNLREYQFGITKAPDKALRTALFYENNVLNQEDKFLNSFGVTFGKDENISVFSELYKDYIGVFRISLGTLISNKSKIEKDSLGINVIDETERKEETIQRIIGGGGNFIGLASYPIFHARSKNEMFRVLSTINVRPAVDVPILGTTRSDYNFNWYNYHEASFVISGLEGNIALLLTNKLGHFLGNESYYNYLNLESESDIRNKGMFLHQFQIGLKFGDIFLITYSTFYGHPFVRDTLPNTISLSLIKK